VSQRNDRIDLRRATRRQVAGDQRHSDEHDSDADERHAREHMPRATNCLGVVRGVGKRAEKDLIR